MMTTIKTNALTAINPLQDTIVVNNVKEPTMTKPTKDYLSYILTEDFDSIDWDSEYIYSKSETIVRAVLELGLDGLAMQMIKDAKEYGYLITWEQQ